MSGGFRFAGIDGHIAAVDDMAPAVRRVVDAARPLDLRAYGLVGRVFALAATGAAEEAVAAVRVLGGAADAYAAGLRRTRDDYLAADDAAAAVLAGADP